jgi:hypothetical protein
MKKGKKTYNFDNTSYNYFALITNHLPDNKIISCSLYIKYAAEIASTYNDNCSIQHQLKVLFKNVNMMFYTSLAFVPSAIL